jgi:hypothetical protein
VTRAPSAADVEQVWTELAARSRQGDTGRATRRVLAGTRHDCFLAVEFPGGRRLLSVLAVDEHPLPGPTRQTLTSGIMLHQGNEPDSGRSVVDLLLLNQGHSDIFTALVADMLDALSQSDTGATSTAGEVLTARVGRWQQMLTTVRPEGMPAEAQRGLYGELSVLRDLLLPISGADAVRAWTGPEPALQDFQFPGVAIEVKTASGAHAHLVRISSERQLEDVGATPLYLVTLALDVRRGGSGEPLPHLVADLRTQTAALGVSAELDQRLVRAGYLETQSHLYAERCYSVRRRAFHRVTSGFPRLVESTLPPGVSDVSYTLDLMAASEHQTTEAELTSRLR